ncbi:MAG TPA: 3-oxoacyl-ACP reductase family protein [Dongiaceae bacterium]|jgi:3-oxoacyl-[acyl-carrier protein] reductase|nr:3-oxoacyl-ACP reductase family protein [Dongiaceae bacterium]
MRELEGKVALVTGGARNIGRAIAIDLAEAGAGVVVNTRHSVDLAKETVEHILGIGGRAILCRADVTDPKAVQGMVDEAIGAFGGIDILVNNAAVRKEALVDSISFAEWREVLSIMLDGAFLCTQACLPSMRSRGGASIVNIGGLTGHTGAAQRVHVVTGKAGLAGFTKALAHDLAADGITVNCVVPGLIETDRGGTSPPVAVHHIERKKLLGRKGKPEEVAAMVRYLCGPRARYVTGQSLHVNGGIYMP